MATDPIELLKSHLPAIRAAAAIDYDGTGPASMLLSNYDLWLKTRERDPNAIELTAFANGVQYAFTKWRQFEADKVK